MYRLFDDFCELLCLGNLESDYLAIRRAVSNCGAGQWYEIGLELGMKNDQIKQETRDKSYDAGKVLALIETRRMEFGMKQTIEDLLKACCWIPIPIHNEVLQQWKKGGEMFQLCR